MDLNRTRRVSAFWATEPRVRRSCFAIDVADFLQRHPETFPADARGPGGYRQVEPERFPVIAEELLNKGYRESEVQGILGHNNLRLARRVWKS
jgi:microsomal dipeptidase-like Zn-dependent dipeptidase